MTRARKVSQLEARLFLRRAHLIDSPAPDVGSVLAHHGYVQIDPINICGRMHDHILRNRVAGYREGCLLYTSRPQAGRAGSTRICLLYTSRCV